MPDNEKIESPDGVPETNDAATQVFQDLDKLREERDSFHQLLLRTKADFENYQKRAQRDQQEERRYALKPLVLDLLPALDNLDRALASVKEESPLSQGVALVRTQLLDALKRHGITRIETTQQPFDPHQHEAMMEQPASDQPPGTVLQVLEPGYVYNERVLRPSKVIVSK
jgi:molecular chaperone GrpE